LLEAAQEKSPYRCPKLGRILNPSSEICKITQIGEPETANSGVLIIGDSHADQLDEMIADLGDEYHVPVYLAVRNCDINAYGTSGHCSLKVRDKILEQIHEIGIQTIISVSFWHSENILNDFDDIIDRLIDMGTELYISEVVPHGEFFNPERKADFLMGRTDTEINIYTTSEYEIENTAQIEIFDKIAKKYVHRVSIIKPRKLLCSDDQDCEFSTNGFPNYLDDGHLTEVGANRLRPMYETI